MDKKTSRKRREDEPRQNTSPPENLWQAFFNIVWNWKPLPRNIILLTTALIAGIFLLWNSLTDNQKNGVVAFFMPTPPPTPIPSPTTSEIKPINGNHKTPDDTKHDEAALLAEFVLDENKKPQFILDEDKVTKHYKIVLFVKNTTPDITSITYDPWDPSYGERTYTSDAKPDFRLHPSEFTAYGDDHIEIIRRTRGSESYPRKSFLISTALEQKYTGEVSDSIRDAIAVIKNNLQD